MKNIIKKVILKTALLPTNVIMIVLCIVEIPTCRILSRFYTREECDMDAILRSGPTVLDSACGEVIPFLVIAVLVMLGMFVGVAL